MVFQSKILSEIVDDKVDIDPIVDNGYEVRLAMKPILRAKDRINEKEPVIPVVLIYNKNIENSPVFFYYLDKEDVVKGGVLAENEDITYFVKRYETNVLEDMLKIFKVKKVPSSDIAEIIKKEYELEMYAKHLENFSIPYRINNIMLSTEYSKSFETEENVKKIFAGVAKEGVDIKEVLKVGEKDAKKYLSRTINALKMKKEEIEAAEETLKSVRQNTQNQPQNTTLFAGQANVAGEKDRIADNFSEEDVAKEKQKRLSEQEFKKVVDRETLATIRKCRSFWSGFKFDKENPMHASIVEEMQAGQNALFVGETGIGKTYSLKELAEINNAPIEVVRIFEKIEDYNLTGGKDIVTNADNGGMEMAFLKGPLVTALENAIEASKKGKGVILVLDEILRAMDNSLFISGFSEVGMGEYCFDIDQGVEFRKINTPIEGPVWFRISDVKEENTRPYKINSSGEIFFMEKSKNFLFSGNKYDLIERDARGYIPTITKEEYATLIKGNSIPVVDQSFSKRRLYVPSSAIFLAGTGNAGEGYTTGISQDKAFFRRFVVIPVEAPPVSYMVKKTIEMEMSIRGKEVEKEWEPEKDKLIAIFENFFIAMDKKINSTSRDAEDGDFGEKVNFDLVKSAIRRLPDKNPLDKKVIKKVFERISTRFAPIDLSQDLKEINNHSLVIAAKSVSEMIMNGQVVAKNTGITDNLKVKNTLENNRKPRNTGIKNK